MKILRHRLVNDDNSPIPFVPSPNLEGRLEPRYLIIHYTAGDSVEWAVRILTDPSRQVSAHLVIGRDGSVTQLVRFNRIAWHAGASSWLDLTSLNRYSIGIELDNAGQLERQGNQWRAWFGRAYDNKEVFEATHKNGGPRSGWHLYTPRQLAVTQAISHLLVRHYNLQDILGHDDVAPHRKIDPDPAFPMASFRAAIFEEFS